MGLLVILSEHDELVRHDTHLLKGDGLGLSARETLNNPALLALFHLLDLLLDQLDDNLVFNVTVSFEGLLNVLAVLLVLLSDLSGDQVSHRDALEVFSFFVEVR